MFFHTRSFLDARAQKIACRPIQLEPDALVRKRPRPSAFLFFRENVPRLCACLAERPLLPFFERFEQSRLVLFRLDDIVILAFDDRFGCGFLTVQRVERENATFQIELLEELLN